jgi:hypothetical protein
VENIDIEYLIPTSVFKTMCGLRHGNVFTTGNFVSILAETGESLKLDSRIRFSEVNVAGKKIV